jgi:DNA-binding NarL/FixJ family response regulator
MQQTVSLPIRIVVADDHQIVQLGLKKLIDDNKPKMEIAGSAINIADAKRLVAEKHPDILLLNIYLGDTECIDLIPDFIMNEHTRVVIFTGMSDSEMIDRAVYSGARGVVNKKESTQTILKAIEKVHDGELWLDRNSTSRILDELSRPGEKAPPDIEAEKIFTLTRKELAIVRTFAQETCSLQNKQIAALLCISEHTLRNHLTSIFSKLEITNRFDLFMFAKRHLLDANLVNHSSESSCKDNKLRLN